jgi:predicted HTH transcriptional regulator
MPTLFDQPRRVHHNSRKAHAEEGVRLNARAADILDNVRRCGPGTDREICRRMCFAEMNAVRPRITELIDAGLLVELGSVKDATTGKTVRKVGAA